MESLRETLNTQGYAVVENVLNEAQIVEATGYFRKWISSNPQLTKNHERIDPHGIFKFGEVGHQRHAWYIKTLDAVQAKFREIWETDELVTGFDGSCWISSEYAGKDKIWTHTDQAADTKGFNCVQGFVALTNNEERTLVVYEGSHLLHERYMKEKNITGKKNWLLIDHAYLATIAEQKRVLKVKAGSLVLWDSRTFHQNQYGNPGEERIVQYVCFLPKNNKLNSKKMSEKRAKYFQERRTTSHWPYPLHVNGKQPQTYGNDTLLLDYEKLVPPILDDLEEKIKMII